MLTKSITTHAVYFPLLMLYVKWSGMSHFTKYCEVYERHLLVHGRNEKLTSASKFYDILMTPLWYAENEVCPKNTATCISGRRFGKWDPQLWDDEIKMILFVSVLLWRKRIACWKGRVQCSLDMVLSIAALFHVSGTSGYFVPISCVLQSLHKPGKSCSLILKCESFLEQGTLIWHHSEKL